MAVDIKRLGGPEEENGEEVGTGDEGDDKRQGEDPWVLLETRGEHGVFGTLHLPDHEGNEEKCTEKEGDEGVCGFP